MMRTRRYSVWMRSLAWTAMIATSGLELCQAPCLAMNIHVYRPRPYHVSELKPGLTQTPDAALLKKINAKMEAKRRKQADVQTLSLSEMKSLKGRGPFRNRYFAGTFPWHRSFRNANLCNGNLSLSYTDIQVSPARGAGLAVQRTYNSQDDTIGPFGVGWTHAYDIRMSEEGGATNYSDRKDFFGAQHKYHRDADGLYTPPPYLYDQLNSNYNQFLVSAPVSVNMDTDIGMDGTIKHYNSFGSTVERVCDYIQDRYGNRTNLTYFQQPMPDGTIKNLLQSVTDPSGRTLNFHWSNLGIDPKTNGPAYRIDSVYGSNGLAYTVQYTYYLSASDPNAGGDVYNLKSVTLDYGDSTHLNRTTTYTYTSVSDSQNLHTEYGLLASVADPLYNSNQPNGHILTYGYTVNTLTNSAWVSSITEPAGVDGQGNIRTATWAITATQNQDFNSLITEVQCTTGNVAALTLFLYGDQYLRASSYSYSNSAPMYMWMRSYDTNNNVTQTQEAFGSFNQYSYKTDNYTYGPHGNELTHQLYGYGTDSTVYYNGSQYFQKNSQTDANNHTITVIVGDDNGNDPLGIVAQSVGNKGSILHVQDAGYNDPNSPSYQKQYTYYYNQYGQKIKEINLNGVETDYTYGDQWGNLTQVVQDPGTGHLNKATSMSYDINGRVQASTDANGNQSSYSYNDFGQPLTASFPATTNTPTETISYGYDNNGRTQTVTDNRGPTTISYEAGCDRVSSVNDPVTGPVSYTYGVTGERLSMSLPGGGSFTYNYGPNTSTFTPMLPKDDPNSLALSPFYIIDDQNNRIDLNSYTPSGSSGRPIDDCGHMFSIRTNETFQGSTLVSYQQADYTYAHNANAQYPNNAYSGQLDTLLTTFNLSSNPNNPTTLLKNHYTYDNAQQRQSNQFTYSDNSTRTEAYGYDDVNRLSTVNYGDGQTQSYTFDAMGNRVSKNDSVNGNESYSYNAANMLLTRGSNSYTNDANGNTLTGGGRTNIWDSQNRLVSCVNGSNTCSYSYGADGIRHQSVVNGVSTDFVLDQSMFVRERRNVSGTENNYATYLMGPRGPEYRRDDTPGGTTRWYVYDGLGSVVEEVDPSGNVTASRKYDVYGSVRYSVGDSTSKHKFVGKLGHTSEDETGLIYMRARYMDPVLGRFISEDKKENGVNWFAYCGNNPINFSDETGYDQRPDWVDATFYLLGYALGMSAFICLTYSYFPGSPPAVSFTAITLAGIAEQCFIVSVAGMTNREMSYVMDTVEAGSLIVETIAGVAALGKLSMSLPGASLACGYMFVYALIVTGVLLAAEDMPP